MPRAKRIFTEIYPYHITARCINKEWFKIPTEQVWDIFSRHLYFAHHAYDARIISFVLMNNHFHLIIKTPQANIDKIMWYLMTEVSREITVEAGRINQTFGGPYFSSVITNDKYLAHAYKYSYRNPVESGLCTHAEEYKYSTLNALLGFSKLLIPIEEDEILFENPTETLKWINQDYKFTDIEDIEAALSRPKFKFYVQRKNRKPHRLEYSQS